MEIFLLFAVFLFTFALFGYRNFLPDSKLLAWVCSFLPSTTAPPSPCSTPVASPSNPAAAEEEDSEAETRSLVTQDDELESIFSTFDKDGDGFITVRELEESLKRLGIAVTDAEVAAMVEKVDSNGDGLIDLGEFRELYAELGRDGRADEEMNKEAEDEELKEAFGVFDGNRDGMITAEELALVLTSLGLKQGAKVEDCRDMIRKVDMDGDGKVNFQEFKKMMKMKAGRKKKLF